MTILWVLLIISLPYTEYSVDPIHLKHGGEISTLLIIALVAAYFWHSLYQGDFSLPPDPARKYLLLFWLVAITSVAYSARLPMQEFGGEHAWVKSIKGVLQFSISASLYILTCYMVRTRKDMERSMRAYFVGFSLVLVYGLVEAWNHFVSFSGRTASVLGTFHDSFISSSTVDLWSRPRLSLVAQEPSLAANYLLALLPFAVFGVFLSRFRWAKFFFAIIGGLFLFLTFSLGGYLAFLVTGLISLLYVRRRLLVPVLALGLVFAGLVYVAATRDWFSENVANRLLDISSDESVMGRLAEVEMGCRTFVSSPVVGVGFANQLFYFLRDYPDWALSYPQTRLEFEAALEDASFVGTNNIVIRILAETGILGFVFFLLWHFQMFKSAFSSFHRCKRKLDRNLSAAILVASVAMVVEYVTSTGFHMHYVYFTFGLIPAWANIIRADLTAGQSTSCNGTVANVRPGLAPGGRLPSSQYTARYPNGRGSGVDSGWGGRSNPVGGK